MSAIVGLALSQPGRGLIFATNFAYHATAAFTSMYYPETVYEKISAQGKIEPGSIDMIKYLGINNLSTATMCLIRLYYLYQTERPSSTTEAYLDVISLAPLVAIHLTSMLTTYFSTARTGRWTLGHGLDWVTLSNTALSIVDITALAGRLLTLY